MQETHDAKSFVFDVPPVARDDFAYEAGQFCTFRVQIGAEDLLRCYSMSSSPHTDPDLTTTVKRVHGGRVSNWMLDEVSEGDVLALTRPAGVFTLGPRSAPLVAFSGGSGITPVISLIKSALVTTDRSVRLLYANRDGDSVIFADELSGLTRTYPNRFHVAHHLDVEHGFVHSDSATQFVGSDVDADFYVCGPAPFMDVVEDALAVLHVPSDHVFIERFAFAAAARRDEPGDTGDALGRRRGARRRSSSCWTGPRTPCTTKPARRSSRPRAGPDCVRRSPAKRGAAQPAWLASSKVR